MAMLDNDMKIATATFTQDSNTGTQTTLVVVIPELLRGREKFNPG
jgi:hypothetical protein